MDLLSDDEAAALHRAAEAAIAYRRGDESGRTPPALDIDTAIGRFDAPLSEAGAAADSVIADLLRDADGGIQRMTGPGFFAYVCGGSHPVGVAADFLVSAWGQNSASVKESPTIAGIEQRLCEWVIDLLGLPEGAGAGVVTGGTLANTTGIMAARHALLAREGWDVEEKGLYGAPEIDILIGAEAHSAPLAALRYAGFGSARARKVETDREGRIRPAAFAAALDACRGPVLAILQAGQINTGAFDPFAELIPMAKARDAWVHVDGAFGLWLAAVPELRPRLAGVEDADSWAVDLHKWLNAPYDAGLAIVRDRAPLVASMSARGAYLPDTTEHWEPADSVFELSRRGRGVPSYAILRHLGRAGVREMVARHCRLAERLAVRIAAVPGIRVMNEIASNQVAIRCGDDDAMTRAVLAGVQARGRVYPSHGVLNGAEIIRASIIGYAMQDEHVDLLAEEVIAVWHDTKGAM